jgi:hypothetical protein
VSEEALWMRMKQKVFLVEACDRVRFFIRASQAALVQIFAPPPCARFGFAHRCFLFFVSVVLRKRNQKYLLLVSVSLRRLIQKIVFIFCVSLLKQPT